MQTFICVLQKSLSIPGILLTIGRTEMTICCLLFVYPPFLNIIFNFSFNVFSEKKKKKKEVRPSKMGRKRAKRIAERCIKPQIVALNTKVTADF